MCHPRILIVNGQSLYQNNATGITLRSMFSSWPKESIKEVYFWNDFHRVRDDSLGIESVALSPWDRPVDKLFRVLVGNRLSPKFNNDILNEQRRGNYSSAKKKERIKEYVRGLLDISPIILSGSMLKKIDDFSPDVIYTMGSTIYVLKVALFFSKRYNRNTVLHFMDNWRETLYSSTKFMIPFKRKLNNILAQVEKRMKCGLAISKKMALEYSKIYGANYRVIMNSVDRSNIRNPTLTHNERLVFTYAGGLHLNRFKSLLEVEKCLSKLAKQGIQSTLHIYTSDRDRVRYSEIFDRRITKFLEYIPHQRIFEVYDNSDVLVHVESFDEEQVTFTKYSLSTKVSEYLSSGKPVICYAPKELAVSEYIKEVGAGFSVSDSVELHSCIELLALHPEQRLLIGGNAVKVALENHTHEISRNILLETMIESATN